MADLNTTFAGLQLRNPFIISSSGITSSVDRIKKLDQLGAGAVVLKSLFEEQIIHETSDLLRDTDYPEAPDYLRGYIREHTLSDYLKLISESRKAVGIPVIASINCVSASQWMDFAVKIAEAGADALELNVYFLPVHKEKEAAHYERIYFDLLSGIRERIGIPVIIKLGSSFTNLTYMVNQLYYRKANGVVLFNRFYAPDIDIDDLTMGSADVLSTPSDIRTSLRWIAIISSQIRNIDIAGSTGVHSGEAAVKMLLAGARAVQVCSVLYKNGLDHLSGMITRMESWMKGKNYKTIDDFRGSMSYSGIENPSVYERAQFMKYFSRLV